MTGHRQALSLNEMETQSALYFHKKSSAMPVQCDSFVDAITLSTDIWPVLISN